MIKCNDIEHNYQPTGKSYFKRNGKMTGLGLASHGQSISYQTLYCTKCGHTIEIIAGDHRLSEQK